MAHLATALPPSLESLDLTGNVIGDEGVAALAQGMPPELKVLRLGSKDGGWLTQLGCSFSAAGMACLAAGLPVTLEELDLCANHIGDEGVVALAARLPAGLRSLLLSG